MEYNLELVNLAGAGTKNLDLNLNIDESYARGLIDTLGGVQTPPIRAGKDYAALSINPRQTPDFSPECRRIDFENTSNLVAIHPWTSDPVKQWPQNNFYALSKRLIEDLGLKVVIVGIPNEPNKDMFNGLGGNIINLAAKTNLRQLAGILKRCRLLISGDSGPMHLAAAVGTPVLAIFRNDLPGKTAKRWGPWGKGHIVIEKSSLSDITVDEVLEKAKEMLRK